MGGPMTARGGVKEGLGGGLVKTDTKKLLLLAKVRRIKKYFATDQLSLDSDSRARREVQGRRRRAAGGAAVAFEGQP